MKIHRNSSHINSKKSLFFFSIIIFFLFACGIKGRPLPRETTPRADKQKKQQKALRKNPEKEKWKNP